jgi:hypothetical protein
LLVAVIVVMVVLDPVTSIPSPVFRVVVTFVSVFPDPPETNIPVVPFSREVIPVSVLVEAVDKRIPTPFGLVPANRLTVKFRRKFVFEAMVRPISVRTFPPSIITPFPNPSNNTPDPSVSDGRDDPEIKIVPGVADGKIPPSKLIASRIPAPIQPET